MTTLTNSLYNKLKFIALVFLPALGTLYFTLAGIWNLPAAEAVIGTIVAVDTFLGVVLHISTQQYHATNGHAGDIIVDDSGATKIYSLELTDDPDKLDTKSEVTFKVVKRKL